jgi:septal ring factor EnvC (AmiA/AmiB activator)
MDLANFSTFWLQNTTFLWKYGKYICNQSYIFRAKIEKTTSTQSFVVGSKTLLLLLSIVMLPTLVFAQSEQQQKKLQQQLLQNKHHIAEIKLSKKQLSQELKSLNEKIAIIAEKISDASIKIKQLRLEETKLEQLRQEQLLAVKNIWRDIFHQASLLQRVQKTPTSYFINDNNIKKHRTLRMIQIIIDDYQQKTISMKANIKKIAKNITDIRHNNKQQQALLADLIDQQADIKQLIVNKNSLIQTNNAEIAQHTQKVAIIGKKIDDLSKLAKALPTPKFQVKNNNRRVISSSAKIAKSGHMPVSGKRIINFGEKTNYGGKHRGITYHTLALANVFSPITGVVMYAGNFRNYGNVVIIRANNGEVLTIAGMDDIYVNLSDAITTGQLIGRMPNQDHRQLYIELRRKGKVVNPKNTLNIH